MAKSFRDKIQQKAVNPTLQFISTPEPEEPQPIEESKAKKKRSTASSTQHKAPPTRRAIPQHDEETKSRRLQLLLTPSLYESIKDRAFEERVSVNELINSILKDAMRK